jgi:hypothetical protein
MAKDGYFASRCKGPKGRRKIAVEAIAGPGRLPSDRPLEGRGRASPALGRRDRTVGVDGSQTRLFDRGRREQKAGDVLGCQLNPQRYAEGIEAEDMQILVEVTRPR